MTKIYIQTHGCSANFSESEMIAGILNKSGFQIVDDIELSDVNIINICTVKGNKVALKEIQALTEHYPDKKLIVTGCITKDIIPSIRTLNQEASLINTHNINNIVEAVEESFQGNVLEAVSYERLNKANLPKISSKKAIDIVPIASGCVDHCSYCSVKLIKGHIYSFPETSIINQIKKSVENGRKEIWLTSQDNGAYGLDQGEHKLPKLLNKILDEVPGDYKIRLGMANPGHIMKIADELLQIYQDDRMFKFLHIPVESGNNEILGKMNRKYNVHDFKEMVDKFRKYVKDITIATDIIVGFPTETELQFQDSLHLIQDVKPDIVNIARYSTRPRTTAARMKQVPSNIKKERSKTMTELYQRISLLQNRNWVGWHGKVIIDEKGKDNTFIGRNFAYKPVILDENFNLGDEVDVKILYVSVYDLKGKSLKADELKT
jgi:MiaB-like tRNA modifying enzyme